LQTLVSQRNWQKQMAKKNKVKYLVQAVEKHYYILELEADPDLDEPAIEELALNIPLDQWEFDTDDFEVWSVDEL